MSTIRKLLLTTVVLATVGSVAGFATYSAFTATTSNTGNSASAGTVVINQHTGATTMFNALTGLKPGDSFAKCVRVSYTGSITASAVKIYASSGITNGTLFTLKIERGGNTLSGPAADMNCTGFTAASTPFNANIGTLGTTFSGGIDGKASAATWATNASEDYRFTLTVHDDTNANAHTSAMGTGSFSITWEAQS